MHALDRTTFRIEISEVRSQSRRSTRFARASDLFLSKYIKAAVKKDDPAFDGSFRDYLNRAEKLGLIDSTDEWLEIRDLRNVAVHEYSEGDLEKVFQKFAYLFSGHTDIYRAQRIGSARRAGIHEVM
jgi:uncharacterized protein YutE (UPF0331/DUF86 family)